MVSLKFTKDRLFLSFITPKLWMLRWRNILPKNTLLKLRLQVVKYLVRTHRSSRIACWKFCIAAAEPTRHITTLSKEFATFIAFFHCSVRDNVLLCNAVAQAPFKKHFDGVGELSLLWMLHKDIYNNDVEDLIIFLYMSIIEEWCIKKSNQRLLKEMLLIAKLNISKKYSLVWYYLNSNTLQRKKVTQNINLLIKSFFFLK